MAKANGNKPPAKEEQRQKPSYEVRLGRIRGVVWENHHEKTGRWFSTVISRTYKDGQGTYKSATSFGEADLLVVAEVARLCYLWIHEMKKTGKSNDVNDEEAGGDVEVPF